MTNELFASTAFCSEYVRLLDLCQHSLAAWNKRKENARGQELGAELLLLQARFAKAYNCLQKHVQACDRCKASSQELQSEESNSDTCSWNQSRSRLLLISSARMVH